MSEVESGGLITPEDAEPIVKRSAPPQGLEFAVPAVPSKDAADVLGVRVVPGHHAHPAAPAREAIGQLRDAMAPASAGHRSANDDHVAACDSLGGTEKHGLLRLAGKILEHVEKRDRAVM